MEGNRGKIESLDKEGDMEQIEKKRGRERGKHRVREMVDMLYLLASYHPPEKVSNLRNPDPL